jgi:hypothetical protein
LELVPRSEIVRILGERDQARAALAALILEHDALLARVHKIESDLRIAALRIARKEDDDDKLLRALGAGIEP